MRESLIFDKVIDEQNRSIQLQIFHWLSYELFTIQFWLLIAMLILPWIIWWKLVDRKRFFEIVIFGLLINILVTTLDEIGCQLNLWEYRYDLEPLFPRLIPMNFSMLPIGYMLVYQYFTKWKTFIIANILLAAIFAFVGEPIFVFVKIYVLFNWRHIFSFPIYILIPVLFKAAMNSLIRIQHRAL